MKKTTTLLSLILFGIASSINAQQQGKMASLNEDGSISVENIIMPENYNRPDATNSFDRIWRFGEPAHPNIKNTRGVTLADITNNGVDEVLYGIWNTLYAFNGDGTILWSKQVSGTILLPPTVADLNGDGNLEIILNTGGVPMRVGFI